MKVGEELEYGSLFNNEHVECFLRYEILILK